MHPPNQQTSLDRRARQALLESYFNQIYRIILSRQHPISGLLPASTAVNAHGDYTHAWVRDNVYSVLAAWGLALAYRKLDRDEGRTYLLEQSVVKNMRGLLLAMMRQSAKVEEFKKTQQLQHALHAKYDTATGNPVVGDEEWGHLQLDATSLFLLMIAQMTASGLRIVFTPDEVDFVQNLVHYVGRTYRTADFGIWERGNKINHGITEHNASSVGMAKAALEALRDFDLFGGQGGDRSVIHVMADDIARSRSTLESLLPRESGSKETDAALLSIIGFPAFAVEDRSLVERTRRRVIEKLQGRYGCKRFLLDGHQAVLEDTNRLHYEPQELKQFQHIESEWPLFFTYLMLDALFRGDREDAERYRARLAELCVERDGMRLLPELYYVPAENVEAEKRNPHSQPRVPNANVPLVWAQSLYFLGQMLQDGLLDFSDIDPLGRRWRVGRRRATGVQLALLSENDAVQRELEEHGISTQTLQQAAPVQVRRASDLADAYALLGENEKLGLSGRPKRRLRSLATSQVFKLRGETVVFVPEFLNPRDFYLMHDNALLVEQLRREVLYHHDHWDQPGRPLLVVLITPAMLRNDGQDVLLELMEELQTGECNGAPVRVGRLAELLPTAGTQRIDYLHQFRFTQPSLQSESGLKSVLKYAPSAVRPMEADELQRWDRERDLALIVNRLADTSNPYEQIELLGKLYRQGGLCFETGLGGGSATVEVLTEELYDRAGQLQLWAVVRKAAALLNKFDVTLQNAVTEIVVRQKQIAVGRSYSSGSVLTKPLSSLEILETINTFSGGDERERVMKQEILLYLGMLIKTEPKLFSHMITVRVGHLMLLLISRFARANDVAQDEAFELLMEESPYSLLLQVHQVLTAYSAESSELLNLESLHRSDSGAQSLAWVQFGVADDPQRREGEMSWRSWREHQGVIGRAAEDFYAGVWEILGHCKGLVIGEKLDRRSRLESTLRADMTANEKNFALRVEHLLNRIQAPEYRQLNIEAVTALGRIMRANPSLAVDDFIVLDVLIGHAVRLGWLDLHPNLAGHYDEWRSVAWNSFYETSPHQVENSIMAALAFLLDAGHMSQPTASVVPE